MKKTISACLVIAMLISFVACSAAPAIEETPQPAPEATPEPIPEPTPMPEPTSIQATSREDLLHYGFSVKENWFGPTLSMQSRISESIYTIQYLDVVEDWFSWKTDASLDEAPLKAAEETDILRAFDSDYSYYYPCIIDETLRIIYFMEPYNTYTSDIHMHFSNHYDESGELKDAPVYVICYYPEIDQQAYAPLYADLAAMSDQYEFGDLAFYLVLDSARDGYQFTVRSDGAWLDDHGHRNAALFNLTELAAQYMDMDVLQQEAFEKYQKFNENLQREFGATAKEILSLK